MNPYLIIEFSCREFEIKDATELLPYKLYNDLKTHLRHVSLECFFNEYELIQY